MQHFRPKSNIRMHLFVRNGRQAVSAGRRQPRAAMNNVLQTLRFPPQMVIFVHVKTRRTMKACTYVERGRFELREKPEPRLETPRDALVRVTLASICTSDLHILHGSVPRAVEGITVGHEMVGVVEQVGAEVATLRPGDRVAVNVETFCGECYFCRHGYVNNCTDPDGGWALGCRCPRCTARTSPSRRAASTAATAPRFCI